MASGVAKLPSSTEEHNNNNNNKSDDMKTTKITGTTVAHDKNKDGSDEKVEPIWLKDDKQWELTWPIWHMLPRDERKTLANRYGYKTIGDFEEYMILRKTVGVTEDESNKLTASLPSTAWQRPYDNAKAYPQKLLNDVDKGGSKNNRNHKNNSNNSNNDGTESMKPKAKRKDEDNVVHTKTTAADDDDIDNDDYVAIANGNQPIASKGEAVGNLKDDDLDNTDTLSIPEDRKNLTTKEIIERGGLLLTLPDDLLHNMVEWLPVDTFATISLVSPHWKFLSRTESVYKRLCERIYLNQAARRVLHVHRFHNSYRNMLQHRPRVRTGLYVLKFARVKPIQRDMWTEIPVGAILETVYYRYLYFQENGTLLYALTPTPPHDMIRRLKRVQLTNEPDRAAVWGTFQVQGKHVTVLAKQEWQTVKLELTIQAESPWGRFGALSFDRHLTSSSGDFDEYFSRDLNEFNVPLEEFRYLKDKRL